MNSFKKIIVSTFGAWMAFIMISCEDKQEPGPSRTGEKPDAIRSYDIKSIAGGAIINYALPSNKDLRYVKAVYTLGDGSVRENKASIYKNSIVVDGFAQAGDYQVNLIAVAVGEVESEPTSITVTTLTPPYLQTLETIAKDGNLLPTFGGIRLNYENTVEAPLVIHVLTKNQNGQWERATDHYTKRNAGMFNVRGYAAEEREFGIYITDRWNNHSDTLVRTFVPIFEVMMDKSLFKTYNLPSDTYAAHTGFRSTDVLWDGADRVATTILHTKPGTGIPQHFSFDMGVSAMLSRFVMYSRLSNEYRFNHPKVFELWGSNAPNPDGSWESWTQVGTFTSIKPSGLPLGEQTADDIAYARAGEEFDVELQQQPYRYWRFRTLDTWGGNSDVALGELTFYGRAE
ncbi:DUF5000 domain-containing lipoprotein [Sphingobacterium griseoflavum]|uniref:DUF4959 domain-containing protein n=1 Tax=Sphingobacterium griseoflavum TaxID=1474952 RepID=A0ABQ3HZ71_9SPHI|nr:DUF5000 domain-containing lipoprotein [Sphingobacterium griseoflavum]GHE33866.1 hypothetical protein GCM10017764_16410 [Sphingobacterium griseoflavum]